MNTDKTRLWVARDKTTIAPFSRLSYFPVAFKSGRGALLEDVDGNQFIDLLSSAGSQNLGHAHPAIIEAVHAQMQQYTQFTNAYFYNPIAAEFAEALVAITPVKTHCGDKKVAFGLSGSDGIDGAIKLARAFTGRNKLIAFEGAYHGSTFGAISVSFVSPNMRQKIGGLLADTYAFRFPNPYHDGDGAGEAVLGDLRRAFASWLPPGDVAAIIIEPLQGDGGLLLPTPGFYQALAELCQAHGILLIDDEIQQGYMRTGKWFGIEHFDVSPDIIVTGKAMGGGLPLSAIIARSEIMDTLEAPAHLFTMAANATCCAAGLASLKVMQTPGFAIDVNRRSARMRTRLEEMALRHPSVGDVRGIGFSIGVEIVRDRAGKVADVHGAKKICYRGWEKGILMICIAGNVLRIQPPLVISDAEIEHSMDILEACIDDMENGRIPDDVVEAVAGW